MNARIKKLKAAWINLPIGIPLNTNSANLSGSPIILPSKGMITSPTSESTIFWKPPPMINPIASDKHYPKGQNQEIPAT